VAAHLGLRLAWFQDKTFAHYDLTRSKRDKALAAGAVAIDFYDERIPDGVLMKNGDGTYETHGERMARRNPETWFTKREGGKTVHNWPSNFFIEPDGTDVEHEYQAEKHRGHPWRVKTIMCARTPGQAKRLGRRWKLNRYQKMEWDNRRNQAMYELVRRKIEDHPEIAFALVCTDDEVLVEKNWWHDNYWGDCTCLQCFRTGENILGYILMAIRDEFNATFSEQNARAA
jgi:hypothetical protein